MNNKGSILTITLGFVLIFTLMGFASIHYAGVQNNIASKEIASNEAFWIADGMVERARAKLPGTLMNFPPVIEESKRKCEDLVKDDPNYDKPYCVKTCVKALNDKKCAPKQTLNNSWIVYATGIVGKNSGYKQRRTIQAILKGDTFEISKRVDGCSTVACYTDPKTGKLSYIGLPEDCSFETVFETDPDEFIAEADNNYTNITKLPVLSGNSVITLDSALSGSVSIPVKGEGFLLLDGRNLSQQMAVHMDGSNFDGIIWAVGKVILINPNINGGISAFAVMPNIIACAITGNDSIIKKVVDNNFNKTTVISWNEIE